MNGFTRVLAAAGYGWLAASIIGFGVGIDAAGAAIIGLAGVYVAAVTWRLLPRIHPQERDK
jgi:hypothetical protein